MSQRFEILLILVHCIQISVNCFMAVDYEVEAKVKKKAIISDFVNIFGVRRRREIMVN